MGNFFTDTMRDSNSYEFEEMVDPITCTPNEEPEENIVEIDETFSEKESSVTTVFSWSNFPNFTYNIQIIKNSLTVSTTLVEKNTAPLDSRYKC